MYVLDKQEAQDIIQIIRNVVDDLLKWDADHDDVLNPEVIELSNKLTEIEEKLSTI